MKPQYANLSIDLWVHGSGLHRRARAICLYRRSVECGEAILQALLELQKEHPPSRRTLTFSASERPRPLRTLRLEVVPARSELRVISIRYEGDLATIEMTHLGLEAMIRSVRSWLAGGEDFCVDSSVEHVPSKDLGELDRQSCELWFWGPSYYGP